MTHTRILIAGSRTISDYSHLINAMNKAIEDGIIPPSSSFEIVSGSARGVDTLAKKYSEDIGVKITEFKPIYLHKNDKGAPLRRNIDMANYSDVLIAVWDGKSRGTLHMVNEMRNRGKKVYLHTI